MSTKTYQTQDKYVLRLPNGLRDRIKAYAKSQGRSMNAEIVRVLEREYPEPWSMEERLSELMETIAVLAANPSDVHIELLREKLEETIAGIANGRMGDVSEDVRFRLGSAYETYLEEKAKYASLRDDNFDEEELKTRGQNLLPEKYVHLDAGDDPGLPNDEEQNSK